MNPGKSPPPRVANEEISALIETLHQTGRRLQELTAVAVDTVAQGVETEEQSRLPPSGDEMQGFLFSEPAPGTLFGAKYQDPPPAR